MTSPTPYSVLLHIWDAAPALKPGEKNSLFQTGHLSIEVKKGNATVAYLGWWPSSYTMIRHSLPRPWWKKLLDKTTLWFTFVEGRASHYYRVENAQDDLLSGIANNISPDEIDTVLVGGKARGLDPTQWGGIEEWERDEMLAQPPIQISLDEAKAKALAVNIQKLREQMTTNRVRYQFFMNNCATVTAKLLEESGINLNSPIWWPSLLAKRCHPFLRSN